MVCVALIIVRHILFPPKQSSQVWMVWIIVGDIFALLLQTVFAMRFSVSELQTLPSFYALWLGVSYPDAISSSRRRFLITFLLRRRLTLCSRSLARWQLSEDWPKGTRRAGAPSSFSSKEATGCNTADFKSSPWNLQAAVSVSRSKYAYMRIAAFGYAAQDASFAAAMLWQERRRCLTRVKHSIV